MPGAVTGANTEERAMGGITVRCWCVSRVGRETEEMTQKTMSWLMLAKGAGAEENVSPSV